MSKQTKASKAPKAKAKRVGREGEFQNLVSTISQHGGNNKTLDAIIDPMNAQLVSWPDAYCAETHVWKAHAITDIVGSSGLCPVTRFMVSPHPDKLILIDEPSALYDTATSAGFAWAGNYPSKHSAYYESSLAGRFRSVPLSFNLPSLGQMSLFGNKDFMSTDDPTRWTTLEVDGVVYPVYDCGFLDPETNNTPITCYTELFTRYAYGASGNLYLNSTVYVTDTYSGEIIETVSVNHVMTGPTNAAYTNTLAPTKKGRRYLRVDIRSILEGSYQMNAVSLGITGISAQHVTIPADGYHESIDLLDKVRCVGLSVLVTNINADLTNGGQIAITQKQGASVSDNITTLYDSFSKLASQPHSYNGPLKKGAYAFIRPEDITWGAFRPLQIDVTDMELLPNIQCAVAWNGDVQAMRIEVDAIFEASTTAQILGPQPSRSAPAEIAMAADVLAKFPNCTENPLHERLISGLRNAAQKASRFYSNNKTLVDAVIASVAKALPAALAL